MCAHLCVTFSFIVFQTISNESKKSGAILFVAQIGAKQQKGIAKKSENGAILFCLILGADQ